MKSLFKTHDIQISIEIGKVLYPLSQDVAITDLWAKNTYSGYTKETFIKEIENENVIVALLRDDPIGYAIKKDNKVIESYVEWEFRDSELEKLLLQS